VVSSGLCTLDSSGDCFRSPNYPSNYGSNQTCTITAHEAVTLSVTSFDVEAEYCQYDYLRVNGGRYCGTTGPSGVQVAAGANITWTSDDAYFFSGFEICGGGVGAFPPNALSDTAWLTSLAFHQLTHWMWVMSSGGEQA
jgi:hypothetical protein